MVDVISLGYVKAFLIDKKILVDTGTKGCAKRILSKIDDLDVNPKDIALIILTHAHSDHIGSAQRVAQVTGAKILMHELEHRQQKYGGDDEVKPISLPMKLYYRLNRKESLVKKDEKFHVNILVDQTFDLKPYGVDGKVVHTPGHSKGSVSILLDNGEAIIGDLLMAILPNSLPKRPIFAYDLSLVRQSMKYLVDSGAKTFYLSHGKSYDLDTINQVMNTL